MDPIGVPAMNETHEVDAVLTATVSDTGDWRHAVMSLAGEHYEAGHRLESDAAAVPDSRVREASVLWTKADCHRGFYGELCAIVSRLDPRPGAPEAPRRPW